MSSNAARNVKSGTYLSTTTRPRSEPPPRAKKHAGFKTVGFRATEEHADLVARAAQAKGVLPAQYLRSVALEWAAVELGEPVPDTRLYDYRNVVESAARARGMSVRQYEAHCARELATRDLGLK